ncbi:IS110 family RNA-guided transposase [Thiorhodovibrio frisius]|uniref:Transposase n=1 Tax=Thiorhodovibrio frisius TaxID=631362 RepID=H8Z7H1_9GAMM|nr:IS110 family transposase [Thiorhodovibrio frisius]EIC20901.1 transposase [Thiorhodovibrio frisius]WPL21958.1 Transposase IS116/IS110/IS902 family protein [Thiorhodovibrio frisius]
MELTPIFNSVGALDIHHAKITACALIADADGEVRVELKEFGGFKRDRRALAEWVASFAPEVVVMESTGIYWKSPYAALERVGIAALVVNARHVKQVPGRKTDIADAQWLAILARSGLLTGSFVPPQNLRELRLVSRQMQKFTGILAGEKNRLHKVLTDGGIRLSAVVSDLHGTSARAMIKGLLAGETPQQVLSYASKRLKATQEELLDALDGELSDTHRFVLREILTHIEELEARIEVFRHHLLSALQPHESLLHALQTIPGLDAPGAAMLLVEIGTDMDAFGSPEKLAAWAGVCPGNNESAGKRKSARARKGNPYVRRILCEAAHAASRTRCALAEKFKVLLVRRGRKRAIFALAHKILKIVFVLIHRGDYYRDATVNYEAISVERNAPRWIRMLRKYHYIPA